MPILGNKVAHFDYDALGRHIRSIYNTDGDSTLDDEDTEWTPRDMLGRPIGIWRQLHPTETSTPCAKPYQLFGYNSTGFRGTGYDASGGILDCPAVRWRDTDDDGGLDETLFYLQDFRGDITGLVHPKSGIVERVRYGLTGRPETFPAADVDFSGTVEKEDEDRFQAALAAYDNSSADYDPRADLDRDGDVDSDDEALFYESFDRYLGLTGNWKLSQGDGLIPGNAPGDGGYDNRFGWRGYWYDAHLQKYHVRHRVYDPREGRWMQNDPLGFGAGDQDLYRYCGGEYSMGYDPLGLMAWYDEAFDWVGNAGAGLGDGLSLGITRVLRNGIDAVTGAGINDAVDTTSAAYQNSVVIGASVTVSVITGGTAAAYFGAGGAVLTGTEMMAVGAFAGYSGAVTAQGVEMLQGRRGKVDFVSIAFNTMLGAVLGGLSYEVEAWLNARYGVMPRLTSEPMPANGSCGNPDKPAVTWNNGWRTADGKFASPQGLGRPGGAAEEAVWNAIEAKPGWMVVRGRVSVRGETGQLRVYDGVAISPSGRAVGLEIKSGSGTMTTAQRAFDSALNATGGQWVYGVGNYLGRTIRRAIEIRRP